LTRTPPQKNCHNFKKSSDFVFVAT